MRAATQPCGPHASTTIRADNVEKVVRVFNSHAEAEAANLEFYRRLTPEQRLRILFQIIADHEGGTDASQRRLQRVCRIVKRSGLTPESNIVSASGGQVEYLQMDFWLSLWKPDSA